MIYHLYWFYGLGVALFYKLEEDPLLNYAGILPTYVFISAHPSHLHGMYLRGMFGKVVAYSSEWVTVILETSKFMYRTLRREEFTFLPMNACGVVARIPRDTIPSRRDREQAIHEIGLFLLDDAGNDDVLVKIDSLSLP